MTTFMSEKCGLYEKVAMKGCVFVFLVYTKKKNGCDFVISVITNNQGFDKCYDSLIIQHTTKTECDVLKHTVPRNKCFDIAHENHAQPTDKSNYSLTCPNGHLYNTDTSLLWTVRLVSEMPKLMHSLPL